MQQLSRIQTEYIDDQEVKILSIALKAAMIACRVDRHSQSALMQFLKSGIS